VREGAPAILGVIAVVLAGASVLAVAFTSHRNEARTRHEQQFQRLVGGLGMGPSIDLGTCAADFDPRIGAPCSRNLEPVPGAAGFCPHRGGAALVR
jgi:hypothetical protein